MSAVTRALGCKVSDALSHSVVRITGKCTIEATRGRGMERNKGVNRDPQSSLRRHKRHTARLRLSLRTVSRVREAQKLGLHAASTLALAAAADARAASRQI